MTMKPIEETTRSASQAGPGRRRGSSARQRNQSTATPRAASITACAMPLARTIVTGARIASASTIATSGQATDKRRFQAVRLAASPGRTPARIRPSTTIRALPAAATKSVE